MPPPNNRVALLVTCLVDLMRPAVGFAAVKLLEDAGCTVEVPRQSCCGQPAFTSGDRAPARALAEQVIATFEHYDYVVVPSGSCGGQVRVHYPELFHGDPNWHPRAERFAAKTYELISFLADVLGISKLNARYAGTATYPDSCSSLRELGVKAQPRKLLATVQGLTLREMRDTEVCCGFGGTFCVKYPDISDAIVTRKAANVVESGAQTLLSGDLGCLMNIAGKLQRLGRRVAVRHIAEGLAGMADGPVTGEPERPGPPMVPP